MKKLFLIALFLTIIVGCNQHKDNGGAKFIGDITVSTRIAPELLLTINSTEDTIYYNNEIYVKQYIMKTIKEGKCPKCNTKMIIKDNMFYWRGTYFSGLVCEKCNALYDNPEDSFKKHIQQTK